MHRVSVSSGELRIYISAKMAYKMSEQQQRLAYLPDPNRLIYDINNLSRHGGVPAVLHYRRDRALPELQLYTDKHYYVVLHLMEQYQQGYAFGHIEPMGLREQERMSKGVLLLMPSQWSWCTDPRQLQACHSYWDRIVGAWNDLENMRKQARAMASGEVEVGLPAEHESYLSKLEMLIDLEYRLEQDQHHFAQPVLYYKVEAAGEKRYARDIYTFLLHGSPEINEKNMLRIAEERGLQARVLAYTKNRLTLKFERAIDLDRIPPSGTLEPIVSGAVYRTQQEALETLRQGEARNPYLLRVLVEQHFQPYVPASTLPERELNNAQRQAFQRALTLPDLLCVWGPPGTGKSRTITEIAREYSKQGRRVLITSGTHKAVDNVLEQFLNDEHLMVVRFGHEDRILESVRARLTIDERTREMKQQILKRTNPLAQQYKRVLADRVALNNRLERIKSLLADWHRHQDHRQALQHLLDYASQQIAAPYQPRLQQLAAALQQVEGQRQGQEQRAVLWQQKQQRAAQKIDQPVLGLFYRWRARRLQTLLARLVAQIHEARTREADIRQQYQEAQQQLQNALNNNPEYRQHSTNLAAITSECARLLALAQSEAQAISQQAGALLPVLVESATVPMLHSYVSQFEESMSILEKRAQLLRNWQDELETSAEQLTPEVLRYADIVGTTCIGVATAKGLADIDFDLVIVDEAGQISTPNLLVPLVRARRAILVGDHMQLPPFVDSSVQTWLKNLSPQTFQELGLDDEELDSDQMLSLFRKSAFEQLLQAQVGAQNLVMFTEQRRMPRVIAEFASHHFYNSLLTTVRNGPRPQPAAFFRSELVFVDTSTLSDHERRERKREKSEDWGNPGFVNPCEARLIARLAAHYEYNKLEWGVIVPYRAQAAQIISYLEKLIAAPDFRWDERIATVDSFQGGERDYILYSFTRSNSYGGVGFLSEQRRFNVALTRAKQQLVLVGDLSTLTSAQDADFRALMQHLRSYVKVNGELLTYQECQRYLN